MEILQWVFIIGVSLAIISILFTLYLLFSFFVHKKAIGSLPMKRSRSRRKRKQQKRALAELMLKKKRALRNGLLFLLLTIIFSGGSFYVTYYQATNLSSEDTQYITDGYYYIHDLQEELKAIKDGSSDEETTQQTLTFIATSMAGYAAKQASTLNTVDGQSVLNRYYSGMSELGKNLSRQATSLYTDETIVDELLGDIDKVVGYQTKAFKFFKVNEGALAAEN